MALLFSLSSTPKLIAQTILVCGPQVSCTTAPDILIVGSGCPGFVYFVDCPSSGCCIKSRQLCYDNGIVRVCNETVTSYGTAGSCSGNATFTPPSGCNIIDRSGCIDASCNSN